MLFPGPGTYWLAQPVQRTCIHSGNPQPVLYCGFPRNLEAKPNHRPPRLVRGGGGRRRRFIWVSSLTLLTSDHNPGHVYIGTHVGPILKREIRTRPSCAKSLPLSLLPLSRSHFCFCEVFHIFGWRFVLVRVISFGYPVIPSPA